MTTLLLLPLVTLPKTSLRLSFKQPKEWPELTETLNEAGESIVITKAEAVIGWGLKESVKKAFGTDLKGIDEVDVSEKMAALEDAGIHVVASPADIGSTVARVLQRA